MVAFGAQVNWNGKFDLSSLVDHSRFSGARALHDRDCVGVEAVFACSVHVVQHLAEMRVGISLERLFPSKIRR